ncbi:hypothetical protein [Litchfieldia salsa]|uniref:Uncharacterized protein n=1 Tax=Litchfieldia salsa TaxID=930152 RepID=A0A1H0RSQ7_9BACI|nr:hypothetical protein [Litchfieldia salsa]SDP32544.1 hypothetical protein SAMN05216565_102370 [Litchfieldia salsa]
MISFRGDAHKLYLKLKQTPIDQMKEIKVITEIKEFQDYYKNLDSSILKIIYYRMIKEKNGSGIIPIFVTSVPWFFFLFSKQLQQILFKEGSFLWVLFSFIYLFTLTVSVIIHFREKAWAAVHIEIIQDILKTRKDKEVSEQFT